ncbi:hypothetical protein PHLCEN_2v3907 [Hermanssonia centrifuga]|uniref:Uncharacterized protein n=1 Tax=Hermanssonia centrifuga TaxID=98765 RepID=A0A2R6QBA4_9APHY|nr:hypothetical protein PHLCEN_2v3907 [Hermanssonia centrifuga]
MQPSEPATSKFQFNLPCVLQPVSPALAALHASRARLLHYPEHTAEALNLTHCSRCGSYLLDGSGRIRTIRKTPRAEGKARVGTPSVRVLRRSCSVCGHDEDVPVAKGNAEKFPGVPKRRKTSMKVGTMPPEQDATLPEAPASRKNVASAVPTRESTPVNATLSRSSSAVPSLQPSRFTTPVPTPSSRSRSSAPAPTPSQSSSSRSMSRPKKKSGLQDMLARNRERQEQEKKADGGGLAAFLEGL